MFGVVLWSDTQENKAVIWCEDHGDLAFYREGEDCGHVTLDAGDWVQFDLTTERQMRLAHNPKRISESLCQGLADMLRDAGTDGGHRPAPETRRRASADILTFRLPVVAQRAGRPGPARVQA